MGDAKSRIRAKAFTFLYLIVCGVLAVAVVRTEPGVYNGHLSGKLVIETAKTWSFVSLRAETKPAWHWSCPHNHLYQQVTMTCIGDHERTIQLDLAEGTWSSNGERGTLDANSLARLIAFSQDANTSDSELLPLMQSLLGSLQEMHSGTFLPPNHHGHRIDKPIQASYYHSTLGQNWGVYAIFLWLLAWPVYLVLFKQPASSRWLTPRKAFLVTGCIVIVLDLIFIGIDAVSPGGGVSEAAEFLIGMLNTPGMVVLGHRGFFTMLGLAFGAVSWAVLISAGVLFITAPARHVQTGME